MSEPKLKLSHLEDKDLDFELIGRELERGELCFERKRVTDFREFVRVLESFDPDVVLCDVSLASFTGLEALRFVRALDPDIPFIFVTGAVGEERAVDLLKEGATDYVLKDRLHRLVPAVRRASQQAEAHRRRREAEEARRYREELERVINRFSVHYVSAHGGLDDAIARALEEIGAFITAERVYLYTSSGGSVEKTHVWRAEGVESRERESRLRIEQFAWVDEQLRKLQPVCIHDPADLPDNASEERDFFEEQDLESWLVVPIAPLGDLTGFLGCESRRNGNRWTEDTVTLVRVAGEVFGNALLRARTEKELKDEREFLRKLLDFSEVLVIVLDAAARFLQVNEGFLRVTGRRREECIGKSVFDVMVDPEHVEQARLDHERLLEDGSLADYEAPLRTAGGQRRLIRWKADVIERNGAQLVLASGVDLTDLREAQKRRLRLEAQLARNERIESLGRVAARITHEFNNVLMGIQPFAEIVGRRAGDDEQLRACADRIRQAVRRGSGVTAEVLRFARPSEPERRSVDVCEWLEEVAESHRSILGAGISVSLDCDGKHEVSIDRSQLDQVVVNLMMNAFEAMGGNGRIDLLASIPDPESRFAFGMIPEPERYVHVEIRDDGPGIPAPIIDRLFEPFFTTKHRGTGLGLAISQQIVHAHDGQIFAESREG
ncbi:MAG: ATP-binding protein, partial [Thermoanaerobaculia bacterium]|nr:ATP-binding protein [Thermoanaerobaculia bacterium]